MTRRSHTADAGTTELIVRPMRDDEAAQVRAVATRAFDRFDRALFSTRNRETLVAVDRDDRVVGGVVFHATPPGQLGPLGIVHFIFADPDRRIPGIGTVLRGAVDERFEALGCAETSARIDVTNSASQALHHAGGYRPVSVSGQLRRWGWRLPLRWWQAGTGFDPGMQLWLRPPAEDRGRPPLGRGIAATMAVNLLALAVVAWRAPRVEDVGLGVVAGTLVVTVAVLLGLREIAIRLAARREGLRLGHVSWVNGVGLAMPLAAAFGVWFPLTGSSTSQRPGWRLDRDATGLGRAHLAGALVVAVLAWSVALVEPGIDWLAWAEIQRAAVMLALFDLVLGFSPMIGTAARHVRRWSTPVWLVLVVLGIGPLLYTLV